MSSAALFGVPLSSVTIVIVSGVEVVLHTRYVHVIAAPIASTGPVGESASPAAAAGDAVDRGVGDGRAADTARNAGRDTAGLDGDGVREAAVGRSARRA